MTTIEHRETGQNPAPTPLTAVVGWFVYSPRARRAVPVLVFRDMEDAEGWLAQWETDQDCTVTFLPMVTA